MKRTAIFWENSNHDLQNAINDHIKNATSKDWNLLDIKFSVSSGIDGVVFSALLIYEDLKK